MIFEKIGEIKFVRMKLMNEIFAKRIGHTLKMIAFLALLHYYALMLTLLKFY